MPSDESGRRQLAAWLTDPHNPLTARVYVNRCWHWLFGQGLVTTPDNLGTTGESPSHPELLDDLARQFIDEGWSTKRLVRRLVLSQTYRQATTDSTTARAIDPENKWLWRMNRRRLDAESLYDALLTISGDVDDQMGGVTYPATLAADYNFEYAGWRRSVYVPVFRNALPELWEAFDFADPSVVVGRRNLSTVAPQALYMLNHPWVRERAQRAAARFTHEAGADSAAFISRAYRHILGREPTASERQLAAGALATTAEDDDRPTTVVHALLASIQFRYLD